MAETTGAWAPAAAQVLKGIVRAAAAREQGDPAAFFAEFLQEASVLVRRFRGRAALQRRADAALAEAPFQCGDRSCFGLGILTSGHLVLS